MNITTLREELRSLRRDLAEASTDAVSLFAMMDGTISGKIGGISLAVPQDFDRTAGVVVASSKLSTSEINSWFVLLDRCGALCREAITRLPKQPGYASAVLQEQLGSITWARYLMSGVRELNCEFVLHGDVYTLVVVPDIRGASIAAVDAILGQLPLVDDATQHELTADWKEATTGDWATWFDHTEKTITNWVNEGKEWIKPSPNGIRGHYSVNVKHPEAVAKRLQAEKRIRKRNGR